MRELIGDLRLPDNYLSLRGQRDAIPEPKPPSAQRVPTKKDLARLWNKVRAKQKGKPPYDELAWLWQELCTQSEHAVLNGDADWFERQAKAIKRGGNPQRVQFSAKVVHLLELAFWGTQAKQKVDATLTPAGKFTGAMANNIFNALEKRELPDGHLLVEGSQFESKGRVMEAIHDLAEKLQFELRKQH